MTIRSPFREVPIRFNLRPLALLLVLPFTASAKEPLPPFTWHPKGPAVVLEAAPSVTVEALLAGDGVDTPGTWQNVLVRSYETAPLVAGLKASFSAFLTSKGFTVAAPGGPAGAYHALIMVDLPVEKESTSPIHFSAGVFPSHAPDGIFYKATGAGCRYHLTITLAERVDSVLRVPSFREFSGERYVRLADAVGGGGLSLGISARELVGQAEFRAKTLEVLYAAVARGLDTFTDKMDQVEIENWLHEAHRP